MQDRREEALKLKLEGHTYAAIGEKLGVSRQRIQQMIAPPQAVRLYIIERANQRCQVCSIRVGSRGHVHHTGSTTVEDFNDIDNLVLLCPSCHRKVHGWSINPAELAEVIQEAKALGVEPSELVGATPGS